MSPLISTPCRLVLPRNFIVRFGNCFMRKAWSKRRLKRFELLSRVCRFLHEVATENFFLVLFVSGKFAVRYVIGTRTERPVLNIIFKNTIARYQSQRYPIIFNQGVNFQLKSSFGIPAILRSVVPVALNSVQGWRGWVKGCLSPVLPKIDQGGRKDLLFSGSAADIYRSVLVATEQTIETFHFSVYLVGWLFVSM